MKSSQILPPKAIKEFQDHYWDLFGVKLPNNKAVVRATDFLNLYYQITNITGVKIND